MSMGDSRRNITAYAGAGSGMLDSGCWASVCESDRRVRERESREFERMVSRKESIVEGGVT